MVERSLEEVEVDQRDRHGRTALMWAADTGQVEAAEALLALGADRRACDLQTGRCAPRGRVGARAGRRARHQSTDCGRQGLHGAWWHGHACALLAAACRQGCVSNATPMGLYLCAK